MSESKTESTPIRVFLIDDHRSILWGLERLIESGQPKMTVVGSAENVTAALNKLEAMQPDVVLLDIDLGSENGIDGIPKIAAKCAARILVLTGVRDTAIHDKAVLAGACGVVEKESPAETILMAISKVHDGQVWLDRAATGRIFVELSRESVPQPVDPERGKIATLTVREREIVAITAGNAGATAKTIAQILFISEHTLRNHLTSIYNKLGVGSRLELFAYAHKYDLTKVPD